MFELNVKEWYVSYFFYEFRGNLYRFIVAREISVFIKIRVKVHFGAIFFEKVVFEPSKLKILKKVCNLKA